MKRAGYVGGAFLAIGVACLLSMGGLPASALSLSTTLTPKSEGRVATAADLAAARAEWEQSAHSDTYDQGQGANTTCARCKSPKNWVPDAVAAQAALDCGSCKRVPGEARPDLIEGSPVSQSDWQDISCEICHQPAGDSFLTSIAHWNNELGQYEAVSSAAALCALCHKGEHGFHVVEEQNESVAHAGWECTVCHGPHGAKSDCSDCHDPTTGSAREDHARHQQVNCTACHDAAGLPIWLDTDPGSKHHGTYIPVRFAHTLTSWPSHNQQREVACVRCHHPREDSLGVLSQNLTCEACHPNGAVWYWCPVFTRDSPPSPNYPGD